MKKSTKYLIILIASFVGAMIIFPIILHWVPQEYTDEGETVVVEANVTEATREIPLVDDTISVIDLMGVDKIQNVVIKGVGSPKDQQVYLSLESFDSEKYLNAVDIRMEGERLVIRDLNEQTEIVDSLVIAVANDMLGTLEINTIQTDALKLSELEMYTVNMVAYQYDVTVEQCIIKNFDLGSFSDNEKVYGLTRNHYYVNMLHSQIADFSVEIDCDHTFNLTHCVDKFKLSVDKQVEVSIRGYEGEPQVEKNGHKVFIDKE